MNFREGIHHAQGSEKLSRIHLRQECKSIIVCFIASSMITSWAHVLAAKAEWVLWFSGVLAILRRAVQAMLFYVGWRD